MVESRANPSSSSSLATTSSRACQPARRTGRGWLRSREWLGKGGGRAPDLSRPHRRVDRFSTRQQQLHEMVLIYRGPRRCCRISPCAAQADVGHGDSYVVDVVHSSGRTAGWANRSARMFCTVSCSSSGRCGRPLPLRMRWDRSTSSRAPARSWPNGFLEAAHEKFQIKTLLSSCHGRRCTINTQIC